MASSEDEGEAVPHSVSNYHFVNDKDEPVSFSQLPVRWNDGEGLDGERKQIFLHGDTDNGLQKIHKQVMAWKFDLSDENPQILVLSKENNWIKLQKPRKSFEDTIRTILITVHCLYFVKKNPELSRRSLWDHLSKVFRLYEIRPSENDLIDHANIISKAVEKDEILAKSKFLVTFLEEKPRKKKALDEDLGATANFIVDDEMIDELEESDGSDEEDDLFDSVCAICDNGGDILCCEGRCMRSFHATVEAGSDSSCESLGLTNEHVEAIQNFFCKNCQYKRHQCFCCGELGSSDKSSGAEVFPCVSATCGRFYHPRCVAKLLHRESAAEVKELQKKISDGESFTCPIHKCFKCKQGENKMDPDLQFAVCRRCPTSYHRKCLPRKIAFEDVDAEGIIQRAWEDLIPNRILIYCLDHDIDDELGTPIRMHIKFPDDGQKNKKQVSEKLQKKEGVVQKKYPLDSADACRKSSLGKVQKGVDFPSIKAGDGSSKKRAERLTLPDPPKKQKVGDASVRPLNRNASVKVTKSTDENKVSLGDQLYNNFFGNGSVSVKSRKEDTPDSEPKQTLTDKPLAKEKGVSLPLDDASKQRILALVKDAGSSITLEKIIENHKLPTTYGYSSRNVVDKSLTLGKVEVSIEAISAALKELEEGCSVEDAKTVCEPELLNQIVKWKNKLGGYLSPFLNGARYTSLGRHFTKVDKLKEIVDLLHYYVQDGDMMVDFCCGSNDFSLLMKDKLDKMGTRCSYKNYDLVQAKNNFNFEKRDWMTVKTDELPTGSKLIMGLNPPFGKNAKDANKFIDKALKFKPKLLILIAPPQTERLDRKDPPYDLIWEDDEMLVGKSFYLPGSVDVNDNQLDDWNSTTSLLNLWSRPDWTAKHKAIAQRHGHLSRLQERTNSKTQHETLVSDKAMEAHDLDGEIPMSIEDHPVQNDATEALVLESPKEGFPFDNEEREVCNHGNSGRGKNRSNEDSKKRTRVTNSETQHKTLVSHKAVGAHDLNGQVPMSMDGHPVQNDAREARVLESHKEGFPFDKEKREVHEKHSNISHRKNHSNEIHEHSNSSRRRNHSNEEVREHSNSSHRKHRSNEEVREHSNSSHRKNHSKEEVHEHSNSRDRKSRSNEDSKKSRGDKRKSGRESSETSPAFKDRGLSQERGQSPLSETFDKLPRLSPPIVSHGRSLADGRSSEPPEFGHFLTGYGENRVDDIDRGYSLSREEHVPGATRRWPSGASPIRSRDLDYGSGLGRVLDYGVRNLAETEEHVPGGAREWPIGASTNPSRGLDYGVGNLVAQFPGYHRDTTDNHGHRSYSREFEQNYATGLAIPSDIRLYGQQQQYHDTISGQRSSGYLRGGDPGFSSHYGHQNPAMGSSYDRMSTSAMDKYNFQLNELNHARVNPLAAVPPHHTAGRNGIPDLRAPPPGYRVDSMNFAQAPYLSYSQHSSSGWLN
ncbi:protein ENHANCED DOWNY MILDEW 2-like [Rhododendron vialii]|uniref:protein ENHANCED DOWNY MILDEW 2-like n=1 Tax=Rhododendron vialii TaxID=182163 RepID=UPI00265EFAFD|nr:protein ENHANCED DOWNY MILDEW 2-like [Rhododendron vialii]